MDHRVKLIALDMDETLLNSRCELSPGNREAVLCALEAGIHVVMASGRVRSALPEEVASIPGMRYAVTCNGASVWDLVTGERLYENCIRWEAFSPALAALSDGRRERGLEVFADGVVYAPRELLEDPRAFGVPENRVDYVRKSRIPAEDMDLVLFQYRDVLENINLCYGDPQLRLRDWQVLSEFPGLTVTSSLPYDLEIGGETTSKADGLSHLCQRLGITPEEVMACGDNGNDVEMLRFAGVSVAMGNAGDSVKAAAKYVTLPCDKDGVAAAIGRFALPSSAVGG